MSNIPANNVPGPVLPVALKAFDRYPKFINWQLVHKPGDSKPSKVPVSPQGKNINAHDPTNWMTSTQAYAIAKTTGLGVGYVFAADDPFFFLDLDNCSENNSWNKFANDTCAQFPGAAIEVSQSGKGLHVFGVGTVPEGFKTKNSALGIELYFEKRFVALSGNEVKGNVWIDWTNILATFVPAHLGRSGEAVTPVEWTTEPRMGYTGPTGDEELIKRMLKHKSAWAAFGVKASFDLLWKADPSLGIFFPDDKGNKGRSFDASNADAALAAHLSHWTGCNCERIERLMRQSALLRPKWDNHKDYLRRTITFACSHTSKIFSHPTEVCNVEHADSFDEPVDPFGEFETPDLPRGVLPKAIENFAFTEAALMGVDPGGVAMSALVCCASVITDKIKIQVKIYDQGWIEEARLWVALVGNPSTKKTPAIKTATKPITKLYSQAITMFQIKQAAYEVAEENDDLLEPTPPKRIYANDTTIEALQEILAQNHDGILVIRDELSAWIGSMEKYASGKGAAVDRGFWLEAWNGGPYTVDRVGRGSTYIPNLSVSLIGGIQPDVLSRDIKSMHHDGTLQRFLPVILRTASVGEDKPFDFVLRIKYSQLINTLSKLAPSDGTPVLFDDVSQNIRRAFAEHVSSLARADELGKHFTAWAGKLDGMFARLCLTFHCIEAASGWPVSTPPPTVTEHVTGMVDRFMRHYLIPHGMHFFCTILADGDTLGHTRDIAGLILSQKWGRVRRSDLTRNYRPAKNARGREIDEWLDNLVGFGWLEPEHAEGGKVKAWTVNPLVHVKFKVRADSERAERSARRKVLVENVAGGK